MIAPQKMSEYQQTARRRQAEAEARLDERFQQGHAVARQLADLLRRDFGAERVVLFGSLVDREMFHTRSDIDLAAWGIPERRYLAAVGAVTSFTTAFSVDLARMEEASERLTQVVEEEGVPY
jgi:predicted nucleotidyltransferase